MELNLAPLETEFCHTREKMGFTSLTLMVTKTAHPAPGYGTTVPGPVWDMGGMMEISAAFGWLHWRHPRAQAPQPSCLG